TGEDAAVHRHRRHSRDPPVQRGGGAPRPRAAPGDGGLRGQHHENGLVIDGRLRRLEKQEGTMGAMKLILTWFGVMLFLVIIGGGLRMTVGEFLLMAGGTLIFFVILGQVVDWPEKAIR